MGSARYGAVVLLAACLLGSGSIWAQGAAPPPAGRPIPLEVLVNGERHGTWVLLQLGGGLYAPREAFDDWRLLLRPGVSGVDVGGVPHFPLASVPGYKAKVDYANQSLELTFAADAFAATRVGELAIVRSPAAPAAPALFLNYDLSVTRSTFREAQSANTLGSLAELGVTHDWGVLTTSAIGRRSDLPAGLPNGVTRLETTFTRDFPEQTMTLKVGDTLTQPGLLGRSVYFGGVRLGTNFGLRPGLLTQPLPSIAGVSSSPASVELYVNDVLRQVSSVPTGPFTIGNVPQFSGAGELKVVVRDLLGRETVLAQPFFTAPQLLAPGLMDWSLEAGTVRVNYGMASADYGAGFLSATTRKGLSELFTGEAHVESTREHQGLVLGSTAALPASFLGRAALGLSRSRPRDGAAGTAGTTGSQWMLGADKIGGQSTLGVQVQGSSAAYRFVGLEENIAPIKLQVLANASYSAHQAGTFGVGLASLARHDGSRVETLSANYSVRVLERGVLSFTASKVLAGAEGTSVGISFSIPFGSNSVMSSSLNTHQGQHDGYVALSRAADGNGSPAYRLLAGDGSSGPRAEAGVFVDTQRATVTADVSSSRLSTTARVGSAGGLVLAAGKVFATKRVLDSFAIVEVPGYPDVGVSLGTQPLTRTDGDGIAFVPRLLAYQRNSIRLDPQDLPVSAELDSIEMETVPRWRSGSRIRFPVRTGRGALLRITLDDGGTAPAGAVVRIKGDEHEFYVAKRGEAFVTGLQAENMLTLVHAGGSCTFNVSLRGAPVEDIPRLGPFQCKKIQP